MRTDEPFGSEGPVKTYVVKVFEAPNWRIVLTTEDKAKGFGHGKGDRRQEENSELTNP